MSVFDGHPYLPNAPPELTEKMLRAIGVPDVEALFAGIPPTLRLHDGLDLPSALSEPELQGHVEDLLAKDAVPPEYTCFLGGGVWLHHVPAALDEILARQEFYTSYTQYQPEISQGMLQALFEYQSLIADLTGMAVANSSLYDWASAAGEAARLAVRLTSRSRVVVARSAGPERRDVIATYTWPIGVTVDEVTYDRETGRLDLPELQRVVGEDTAAVYIEQPNFFGILEEEAADVAELAHRVGALFIVGVDPTSLGVVKPPGAYGADVVVGEGQPLGLHPNYGGPLLGIFATRDEPRLVRQIPGRIIGMTTSKDGTQRGYTMVLQAREQHIRREQATSNICTNEALLAVGVAAYLALLGPQGMRELGEAILARSHYLAKRLGEIPDTSSPYFSGAFFKELSFRAPEKKRHVDLFHELLNYKIHGALPLERYYPELTSVHLFSVTEAHTIEDFRRLIMAMRSILER